MAPRKSMWSDTTCASFFFRTLIMLMNKQRLSIEKNRPLNGSGDQSVDIIESIM